MDAPQEYNRNNVILRSAATKDLLSGDGAGQG